MPKIIEEIKRCEQEKRIWYSFEYFPPKTPQAVEGLYGRLKKMSQYQPTSPLFLDVTWGAGGVTSDLTVEICSKIQRDFGEANMHLTCTNMPIEKLTKGLEDAKKAGIRNIVALRGDPPKGQEKWEAIEGGFSHAIDIVKYIRKTHGDYFGVSVAGYPEGHTESKSVDEDIVFLKKKVDAGADFIITQLFYDVDNFIEWVGKCRQAGIKVPIIPGIMPIQSYAGWKRMTDFCKTKIPPEVSQRLEAIKGDEKQVQAYGVQLGIEMCKKILESGVSPGLHFYTLNKEKISKAILEGIGLIANPLPPPIAVPASSSSSLNHSSLNHSQPQSSAPSGPPERESKRQVRSDFRSERSQHEASGASSSYTYIAVVAVVVLGLFLIRRLR